MHALLCAVIAVCLPGCCLAWSGHEVIEGDLRILIEEVAEVTELDAPVPVTITLENTGDTPIPGTVELRNLTDATRVVGHKAKAFTLAAGRETKLQFTIAFGQGTYSALYPVHAYIESEQGGEWVSAHAVRIVSTNFAGDDRASPDPTPMAANVVPQRGALPLWTLHTHRVAWQYYDQPMQYRSAGWTGADQTCRATLSMRTITRGDARPALGMHPPWQPGGGTIFCDYLLELPQTTPIGLTFANAVRDHTEQEPGSDGVWFRVWAAEGIAGENSELLYENFTDAKTWAPGEADLSKYAGKTILLRLESHPGPNNDTSCDSSYWAEPTVTAGPIPEPEGISFEEAVADTVNVGRRLLAGTLLPDNRYTFILGEGDARTAAVLRPTTRGIVDGVLSLVGPSASVSYDGFDIDILAQHAIRPPTAITPTDYTVKQENGRAVHVHHLQRDGKPLELTLTVWPEGDGLRIAFACPERITQFCLGACDQHAPYVYYGHGYRLHNPEGFRAGFGGHNLATSHVGCDYASGMSVLQAVDVPPDYFEVSPDAKRYCLHTHMNGALTLVPSESGAFDCAIKYRPLYDKKAAGAVERKAGRFCFDIWGGRYADIADRMAEMIRYGLTDSFLTVHNWQRWGYDYRLPDIWPPKPDYGTVEDMRKIGEVCNAADIPWGLHDNYTDFYPDATGYSYDHIRFTADGRPIKAWINKGRGAQSYGWRPDRFTPFMKRNLRLIKDGVAPTHYFIDVLTSIGCIDFYDREGVFHSSIETREAWGEAFAWIRDFLGDDAVTTSEAGHDQLTGWLDGADCQHLTLTDDPTRFMIHIPCEDWERVPWFDAVNHSRFILHGVGYSGRYEGGRGRTLHGINSDDYISAEVLEGHALMIDSASWGRAAIRKYWLAQPVARNLALQDITNVEFVGGDMHRQIVTWSNGTKVYVNRGEQDWVVEGHVLPQYGYVARGDGLLSTIEKRDGVFCEMSRGADSAYFNGRTFDADHEVPIEPRVENFTYAGGGEFTWDVVWQADQSAPRDMTVFVHFYSDDAVRDDKIAFQDDHRPEPATNQWTGTVRYSRTITVPENADGEYEVAFGIYDESGRLNLRGQRAPVSGSMSIWAGTLRVEREGDEIADITLSLTPPFEPPASRLNVAGKPVDFGAARTDGAFYVHRVGDNLLVTPLPQSPSFDITLRLDQLGLAGAECKRIVGRPRIGIERDVPFTQQRHTLSFRHTGPDMFDYRLEF